MSYCCFQLLNFVLFVLVLSEEDQSSPSDLSGKGEISPERGRSGARAMVSHLRGRLYDPIKMAERKEAIAKKS